MKEAYSNRLLERVLSEVGLASIEHLKLIDPFSGSGTTGVSAGDLVRARRLKSATVTALEVNPFLHLLSKAKMSGHSVHAFDVTKVAGELARRAMSRRDGIAPPPLLSTFSNPAYFAKEALDDLGALKASFASMSADGTTPPLWTLLRVALAATVEPSSNLRRDGRALRLSPGKAASRPIDTFLRTVQMIADDLPKQRIEFNSNVLLADSRDASPELDKLNDLALFSPPYPNNIDYTEVYKLEGWFLDLYADAADFSDQRRRSLRSHSSLRWGDTYRYRQESQKLEVEELLRPIVETIPSDQYRKGREEVVLGYADDMFASIKSMFALLRPGGRMAIVVGNSMHGKSGDDYVIASDLILAKLSQLAGFEVDRIEVARYPKRRTARSAYLRESIVMARKE